MSGPFFRCDVCGIEAAATYGKDGGVSMPIDWTGFANGEFCGKCSDERRRKKDRATLRVVIEKGQKP